MRNSGASIVRTIDLPRVIVWDAFVDPELLDGWVHPDQQLIRATEFTRRTDPALLEFSCDRTGRLRVTLDEEAAGTRGASTTVTVSLLDPLDDPFCAEAVACWQTRLDQLEGLLRGHPVDWANWERDHGEDYREYLRAGSAC